MVVKKKEVRAEVIKRLLAISAMFLLGACHATACTRNLDQAQIDQGNAYLEQNRSKDTFALMYPLSQQGSGGAHHFLSGMYEQGRGVLKSPFMTRHLNWMGAQENNPDSMYRAGLDFFERGHAKDGEYWVGRAYDCGHTDALVFLLERRIKEGRKDEALQLFEAGIQLSLPVVKFMLAEQYEKGGLDLPKDPQIAFRWFYVAAQESYPKAMAAVAYYFIRGLHGVQDDIAAIHWYHKAARAGHPQSMSAYAWMVANGRGTQVDKEEAVHYFQKANVLGDENATRLCNELKLSGSC